METLLIGGKLDVATPPQARDARAAAAPAERPPGRAAELRAHDRLLELRAQARAAHLVNTFLDSGKVDDSLYTPSDDRLHARTSRRRHSPRASPARWSASRLLTLALAAVADVAPGAQRRQLRTQGERVAAVAVPGRARSRRLVRRRPDRRADDHADRPARRRAARRASRSALPIGLGHLLGLGPSRLAGRDEDGRARPQSAGALVGAWLGFNATTGLLALVTTIVGAAAGANLTLIALDIARERSARDRSAATTMPLAPSRVGACR